MNIKTRLYMSAGISIILVVILLSLVLVTSGRIAKGSKKHELLDNVRVGVAELDILMYDYLLHREERMEQQWHSKYNSLAEILDEAAKEELTSISTDYASLDDLFTKITERSQKTQKLIQEGDSQEKIDASIALEERLVAHLLITSHSIFTGASIIAEEAQAEVMAFQRLSTILTLILMIILAIVVTTSSLIVARSISKPLYELAEGAEVIGKGNLKHKIDIKSKDEIGELSTAFNKMTESLKVVTTSRDELNQEITERKRAEEELRQANIKLQEADRLKSIFLASMSHELRTPLNSIIGFTSIILQGIVGEVTEEQRMQLTIVKKNANHLLELINDLLDISKIEAGRVEISLEEFKLNDVISEVIETVSPVVSEKGLELLEEVPAGITLNSDRRRVKQVLLNLVSNAVKFTEQGSVKIAARVLEGEKLELSVIDSGIGIKEEDFVKLFAPFQQIEDSLAKRYEGTGLGLYLAKKLIGHLGGEIRARSEYGRGSEFTFVLALK